MWRLRAQETFVGCKEVQSSRKGASGERLASWSVLEERRRGVSVGGGVGGIGDDNSVSNASYIVAALDLELRVDEGG